MNKCYKESKINLKSKIINNIHKVSIIVAFENLHIKNQIRLTGEQKN